MGATGLSAVAWGLLCVCVAGHLGWERWREDRCSPHPRLLLPFCGFLGVGCGEC